MKPTCYKNWPRLAHFTRERTHVPTSSPDRLTHAALLYLVTLQVPMSHIGHFIIPVILSEWPSSDQFCLPSTPCSNIHSRQVEEMMSEHSQQLPRDFHSISKRKLPLLRHFLITKKRSCDQIKAFILTSCCSWPPTPTPLSLKESPVGTGVVWKPEWVQCHKIFVKIEVKAWKHHLFSSFSHKIQNSGRTVYSVKIIWTKINQRKLFCYFIHFGWSTTPHKTKDG